MKSTRITILFVIACALGGVGLSLSINRFFGPSKQAMDSSAEAVNFDGLYRACIDGKWPTEADAQRRSQACSQALQTRRLGLDQVALARLTRGVARTMLGKKVASSEDYLEALKHYDSVIDPRSPDALSVYRRAVAEHGLGETDRALADYSEAIRLDPQSPLAYLGRGTLLASRERSYLRAVDDFNRTLQIEPTNVTALIARGDAWGQLGEFGAALADLNQAIQRAPTNSNALVIRGLVRARQGNEHLALQDYDAALTIAPRDSFALSNRAAINAKQEKYGLAIRDLDAALEINNSNPLAFYNRGYAQFALGNYAAAVADYEAALRLDDSMGLAHLNRCLARVVAGLAGKRDIADCDAALKLMPLNLQIRETRGFIFLKLGEPAKALKEYTAALQIDPNRPLALYGRGLAECRLGKGQDGEKDKAAATAIAPDIEWQFMRFGVS
jgi:tetratricopeptide (TPR) repeat protein